MANLDNFLTVKQAAFILKVHPLTIRRYINEGKLKAIRIGGNIRIKESALENSSKEFSSADKSIHRQKLSSVKIFSEYDPLLQLNGIGASIKWQ